MNLYKLALSQRCHPDQNWVLRRWEPFALALKACLCMALRSEAKPVNKIAYFGDAVIVATFDHKSGWGQYGVDSSWREIIVPRSWKRWSYMIVWDGSP